MTTNETKGLRSPLPSFTLLADYHAETQQQLAKRQEYAERVKQAEALVQALEYRYKEAVKRALVQGEDNAEELAQINKERDAAKQELEKRRHMHSVVRSVQQRSITQDDLKRELNTFQAQYQSEQIDPEIEKLRELKIEYLKQFIEIQRRSKHFENIARDVTYTINPKMIGVAYSVGFQTKTRVESACVTDNDLKSLQHGQVPASVIGEVK